jgi:outer membrane biosynthesis protein TonB
MAKKIDYRKFETVVKDLNDSGVLKEKVLYSKSLPVVGIIELFMTAVENVSEAKEKELPDSVIELYNVIAEAQEKKKDVTFTHFVPEVEEKKIKTKTKGKAKKKPASKPEPEPEAKPEPEPEAKPEPEKKKVSTKTKKKSAPKSKAKPDTKEKKEKPETDKLGARIGSGTSKINDMLIKGATLDEIAGMVQTPIGRVKNHIYALTQKGYTFNKKGSKGDTYYKINIK